MYRWCWILGLVLTACAQAGTPTPSATVTLIPWAAAGTPAVSPLPPATPVIIASPTPSATPVVHVVTAGETLISVAIDYGLSLDALLAANPGVVPEAMSVGTVLIIPLEAGAAPPAAAGQPTPLPVDFALAVCYDTAGGGRYCLVEARNPGQTALEAVTARVVLAGADGLPVAEALAEPALRAIPPGAAVPLVAYFPAAPAGVAAVGVTAALALPLAEAATRYPALEVTVAQADLTQTLAALAGTVRNPTAGPVRVRLAAALYDSAGRLAGCRWVEWPEPVAAGEARPFTLDVAALGGGPAARYQLWAEGQP